MFFSVLLKERKCTNLRRVEILKDKNITCLNIFKTNSLHLFLVSLEKFFFKKYFVNLYGSYIYVRFYTNMIFLLKNDKHSKVNIKTLTKVL